MEGTFWAVVPALITIALAIITKEVYVSLFVGIFTGAMMLADGNFLLGMERLFKIMANTLSGSGDEGGYNYAHGAILIFILMLGILIVLIEKSGGTHAIGRWFSARVKSRRGILGLTAGFGVMMFMDDYFNRLATGAVMRPITDQYKISRAKLAYIIGALCVSVCILCPISSWSSFVTSTIQDGLGEGGDGFGLFIKSIVCNFYPIITILFIFVTSFLGVDFWAMRRAEKQAIETGDVTNGLPATYAHDQAFTPNPKGTALDLVLPILAMILFSIGFMIYFAITRDGSLNSEISLACGSTLAVAFTIVWYLPRKILNFKEFTSSFGDGFKSICDALMILVLAWTLSDICSELKVDDFIVKIANAMGNARVMLPALMMVISMIVAFAIGTSWGTFGIIVPMVIPMFSAEEVGSALQLLTISAVLSGAVFGDQVSPISDVTILSSAASRCNHLHYIKAQLPIALLVAGMAFLGFLFGGITQSIWVGWIFAGVSFVVVVLVAYLALKKQNKLTPKTISFDTENTATTVANEQ